MGNKNETILECFSELLKKSEERIDRTNSVIEKCVLITEKITEEYISQINKLQESRDELLKQNKELILINEKYCDEVRASNKRYDLLLERIFSMNSSGKSENNITVK